MCWCHIWRSLQFSQFLNKTGSGGRARGPSSYLDFWISPCQSAFRFFFRSSLHSFLFNIRIRLILFRMKTQGNSANVVRGYFLPPPSMKWTTQNGIIFVSADLLQYNNMSSWDLERNVKLSEGEGLPYTAEINGFSNWASSCRQFFIDQVKCNYSKCNG